MNLSRFFAATNREAMRQVRLALGPEALIISNRRVNGGVEIVATDQTAVLDDGEAGTSVSAENPSVSEVPGDHELMQAIGAMRGELLSRIDDLAWAGQLRRAPQLVTLFQSLLGFGFSTALLRAMLKRLPGKLSTPAAFQWARNELITHLPVMGDEGQLLVPGAIIALVGPTGVGKTTTIAKLAARCVRYLGPDNVMLITTDTYRIGAYEQLRQYGQMMGVSVGVAGNPDELLHMVDQIPPDKTVFIDNVGVSQRDGHVVSQAAMLARISRPVTRLLVLNAASHGDTLDEVARLYAVDSGSVLAGCIISKVDEANRLGAVLDTTIRYRLPVHYVSNGQRVPQDLLGPDTAALVDRAFSKTPAFRPLYAPTEGDLLALLEATKQAVATSAVPGDTGGALPQLQQWLSGLLTLDGNGIHTKMLAQAHEFIDDHTACFQAYGLWRERAAAQTGQSAVADVIHQLLGGALSHFQGDQLLAIHVGGTLRHGHDSGRMSFPMLFDSGGEALIVPLLQLQLRQAWMSTVSPAQPEAPPILQAVSEQLHWFSEQAFAEQIVHLFDGGGPVLWRTLAAQNRQWLARCSGKQPIVVAGQRTLVGAAARTAPYRIVPIRPESLGLSCLQGLPVAEVDVWASAWPASLTQRGQPDLPLQCLSVRLVRRSDGQQLAVFHALGHIGPEALEEALWPVWLLVQAEARGVPAYATTLWPWLRTHQPSEDLLYDALVAAQAGLAAWAIQQISGAGVVREVLAGLSGSRKPSRARASASLLRLFASRAMQDSFLG